MAWAVSCAQEMHCEARAPCHRSVLAGRPATTPREWCLGWPRVLRGREAGATGSAGLHCTQEELAGHKGPSPWQPCLSGTATPLPRGHDASLAFLVPGGCAEPMAPAHGCRGMAV